jgi:hypothetical protein
MKRREAHDLLCSVEAPLHAPGSITGLRGNGGRRGRYDHPGAVVATGRDEDRAVWTARARRVLSRVGGALVFSAGFAAGVALALSYILAVRGSP